MTEPVSYKHDHPEGQPPYLYPGYTSTVPRAPKRKPIPVPHTLSEITGPSFADGWAGPDFVDLTKVKGGEALGERIILEGRVLDEDGKPVPRTLVELWQCNAAGRYIHPVDQHDAPLDPHFVGAGQVLTGADGSYRFLTIKPGAYPWRNSHNAWRPAHIHFSVFGQGFASRLVTQMYFPNDPLLQYDPIYQSTPDEQARERMVSSYDPNLSQAEYALGYRFDIVLRGRDATPFEGA